MSNSRLCIVDTNVAITANLATQPDPESDLPYDCIDECIRAIKSVIKNKGIVIDAGWEILKEYMNQISNNGQQGVGDRFIKWILSTHASLPETQRVTITKNGYSYNEFPQHKCLSDFDPSDRKFVAVSNAHPNKPKILQSSDSKWWGKRHAFSECGITVDFLCLDYIQAKHQQKMGK